MMSSQNRQPYHTTHNIALRRLLALLLIGSILSGCAGSAQGIHNPGFPLSTSIPIQTNPPQPTETTQAIQSQPASTTLWLDPLLPDYIFGNMNLPDGWSLADPDQADLTISFGEGTEVSQWILVLAAPFATLLDEISSEDLLKLWQGASDGKLSAKNLLLSETVFHALTQVWGKTPGKSIQVIEEEDLLQTAWDTSAVAIIPFDRLEPRWKVISVNGQTPIHNDFNPAVYPLAIPITLQGDLADIDRLEQDAQSVSRALVPASNRDASKLTVVAMTGVTALVRATAYTMEQQGITYPGQAVQKWLSSADITHISNEAAFADNCPPPSEYDTSMVFCSSPKYIELLEYVGTDIVELTGDHLADWGQKATYLTLKMYKDEGWPVYGGGENLAEGNKPVFIEHNGNRLAFIGCNAKGAAFATATDTAPGAVPCDFSYMKSEVQRLAALGWLPIVSIQHNEYDLYEAQEIQQRDFRRLAKSGAVIVSGSQSHRPQGMEFYGETFLHYGLGNLFFDQYHVGEPNRQGFIDRHVFYDNRYINTELIATYLVDYAQPQILTGEKRQNLLETIFIASGW